MPANTRGFSTSKSGRLRNGICRYGNFYSASGPQAQCELAQDRELPAREQTGKFARMRGLVGQDALARYAAPNPNFLLMLQPHNGLGAQSAPKQALPTSQGYSPGYEGIALG
jgi:hypothetical protein